MDNEDVILSVIATALGKASINIGCSYNYLELSKWSNASSVASALNEKFDLQMTGAWVQKASSLKDIIEFVIQNGQMESNGKEYGLIERIANLLKPFDNDYDRLVYSNIPSYTLSKVRRDHKLGSSVKILYYREVESYRTFILTEDGISYSDTKEPRLEQYSWGHIRSVEFNPKDDRFYFYFSEDSNDCDYYYGYTLLKTTDNERRTTFANVLTQIAECFENEEQKLMDQVYSLMDEEKHQEALDAVNKLLDLDSEAQAFYHFLKTRILVEMLLEQEMSDDKLIDQAKKEINVAWSTLDEEALVELRPVMNTMDGILHNMCGESYQARNFFVNAMDTELSELKTEAEEYYLEAEEALQETWNNYTKVYDYKERKFIMPVKDIAGCTASDINVFRMNNIPSCFHFPAGHPVANELYIGHPYNPSVYIPYEGSEYTFFLDKIDELCYLLQCLGATEISVTAIRGKSVNELNNSATHVGAEASVKFFSGSAEYDNKFGSEKDSQSKNSLTLTQKFDPLKAPYLPEDLIWYPEQTNWQRLVQQRINGNMLEYHQTISTSETKFVSTSEENDLKASAKFLWTKVNASYKDSLETKFRQSVETEWKVDVKFRSIMDFNQSVSANTQSERQAKAEVCLTSEEKNYREEVLFCLEEGGVISDAERLFLERKRKKWGISEKRAQEIENACLDELLTDEEKEYVEELQAVLRDGVVPDNTRRLLERVRKSLNITEERAKEVELSLAK